MLLLALLSLLGGAAGQFFYDCNADWQQFDRKCYHFVFYPVVRYSEAKDICANDGAIMLSIDTRAEHDFIANWLNRNDNQRNEWYTSGVRNTETATETTFVWEGTGKKIVGDEYWATPLERNKTGANIVYKYGALSTYGWVRSSPLKQLPYICELPQAESWRILKEDRDFSYGVYEADPNLIPRGPEFIYKPKDTTILLWEIPSVYLDCVASGYPQPTYRWLRAGQEVNGQTDPRYILTNGRLTIVTPTNDKDAGSYTCVSENESGKIRSSPAQLSFATLGEFSNVNLASVQPKQYEGAVIECPYIQSNSESALKFQWLKVTSTSNEFLRPELNQYLFISGNGKLYFSEVSRADDGTYHCIATLTSLSGNQNYIGSSQTPSRTSKGIELQVQNQVGGVYAPTIQDSFINVVPGRPLVGNTVTLECFAYGTGPLMYVWSTDFVTSSRFTKSDNNRKLVITDLRLEDSGIYTCNVTGKSHDVDSRSYTLHVEAKPFFTLGLKNQFIDAGKQLTWRCGATARPSPTFSWYKDGVALGNDTALGLGVYDNSIIIQAVDAVKHNGMYQCSASNKYGTTFSSAQLKVLELEPNFYKHPLVSSLTVTQGGNATFLCMPEGAPQLTYTWLKNGGNMNLNPEDISSRVRMLRNGNLLLTQIQQSDQGRYTCKVENILGSAESSGILHVLPNTRIFTAPSNTPGQINDTAFLFCSASFNPQLDMVYQWEFNGRPIDMKDPHYARGTGDRIGGLFIRGLQYKHEGMFTCVAKTQIDSDSRSALLNVYGPPGEPVGVQVDNIFKNNMGRYSVGIRWWDGFIHGAVISHYILEMRSNFTMLWKNAKNNIPQSMTVVQGEPDQRYTVIENLRTGTAYNFRLRAVNRYGVGPHSYITESKTVPGSPPEKTPDEVGGGGGKVGTLTLRWKPLPAEDQNGWGIGYLVHWRLQSSGSADSKWNEILLKGNASSITTVVGDKNYYIKYEVRIQPYNMFGLGNWSHIATVYSAEGMPIGTPGNVYAQGFNSTALTVRWNPVPNDRSSMKGRLFGYKVNYWVFGVEDEVQGKQAIFKGQMHRAEIIGLQPNTWYYVNVMVYNTAGNGPRSEFFKQTTDMMPPQLYPTEVAVFSHGSDSVRVTFRGVSTFNLEEPLIGYYIRWWQVSDDIRNAEDVDCRKSTEGIIYGVRKGAVYTLRVLGYSRGGDGKMSSPETIFMLEGQVRIDPSTSEVIMGAPRVQSAVTIIIISLLACLFALL